MIVSRRRDCLFLSVPISTVCVRYHCLKRFFLPFFFFHFFSVSHVLIWRIVTVSSCRYYYLSYRTGCFLYWARGWRCLFVFVGCGIQRADGLGGFFLAYYYQ
ncbi:hypothetical protein FN846DRAFT_583005 [Sphaerosporella brunnea]|uniref:Uncharacterized protein n=1 Tax=Sphaerosporella brunnea TaxID=1250544 RepID=A0A5J5F2A2_9PEZI|nr:hypothetical protein FN846DRAFT_583005 [Sphaerosporella brunnea]